MTTRTHRPGWLKTIGKIMHPGRTLKRSIKRKMKTKRTRRPSPSRHFGGPVVRVGGYDSIRPGRTIVEWLPHPELGRGRVLAFLPGRRLDVEFEAGGRPPYGIEIEDIRVLA